MVDQASAAAEAAGATNARFEVGDVQVHPFPPAAFDLAVSHFGIMFFEDAGAAFANVARALRPGGRLAFVCPQAMDRCEWYVVPLTALMGQRPTPDTAPSKMFSLADPAVIEDILGRAGFVDVRLEPLAAAQRFGPDVDTAVGFFAGSGPARAQLERRPDLDAARVRAALAEALAPYQGDDGVRIPGAHWLVTAQRPVGPAPGGRGAA